MTKQQHLDEAAKAAGFDDYTDVLSHTHGYGTSYASIHAHATTLAAHRATQAELAERDRVLGEIAELADEKRTAQADRLALILKLAAPYRVKVDPLVEAFNRMPATFDAQIWADTARKTLADLGLEIVAQRGD